jgi:hypothetical protein
MNEGPKPYAYELFRSSRVCLTIPKTCKWWLGDKTGGGRVTDLTSGVEARGKGVDGFSRFPRPFPAKPPIAAHSSGRVSRAPGVHASAII